MKSFPKILFLSLFAIIPFFAGAQKFDRGLSITDGPEFMPKGQIIFGGTISYQDYKFYDFDFLILDQMNFNAYTLKVTPNIYYSFAKNMAVGIKFSYQRTLAKIDEVNLNLSEDLNFAISDFYSLQHTYNGSLSYRYYMPLGNSLRFGLFSDIMLNFGMGQAKIITGTGENVSGVFQEIIQAGVDVVPGVVVFMSNEISVEASVGILGLTYKQVKQTKNQVYEGSYETSAAKFKINLLTIGIGVNFVLPVSKK